MKVFLISVSLAIAITAVLVIGFAMTHRDVGAVQAEVSQTEAESFWSAQSVDMQQSLCEMYHRIGVSGMTQLINTSVEQGDLHKESVQPLLALLKNECK